MDQAAFIVFLRTADFSKFENQRKALFDLGHFRDYDDYQQVVIDVTSPEDQDFRAATASLQSYGRIFTADRKTVPLRIDADFGHRTAASLKSRFCACPDIRLAGGQSKWSFNDLTTWWRGPNTLGFQDTAARWHKAVSVWGRFTKLTFKQWQQGDHGPNVYCDTQRIDGPGNTLGFQYLPSVNAPRNEKNQQVLDTGENWQQNNWIFDRVVEHEGGHAIGLDHIRNTADEKALMNAYIQELDGPQRLDIEAAQQLYGVAEGPGPGPEPPPTPGPTKYTVQHHTTDGRTVRVTTELLD